MELRERIKDLCKKHGVSVSRLEKDLGFANAYVNQLNPETVQYGRMQKIADYFGVSIDYLMTGKEQDGYYINPETAALAQEMFENKELRVLFDAARDASPEDLQIVYDMLLALKRKEQGNE